MKKAKCTKSYAKGYVTVPKMDKRDEWGFSVYNGKMDVEPTNSLFPQDVGGFLRRNNLMEE